MEKIKQNPFVKKVGFNRIVLCFVLLLMYAFFCALTQGSFFGIERILSTLNYAYFLGFLSLGVTFVIATGGIDFSIGPVMFCCALISGYCFTSHGMPMPVALILSIVIGLIFGIFNGYLVAYWSVPSFITSMASKVLHLYSQRHSLSAGRRRCRMVVGLEKSSVLMEFR